MTQARLDPGEDGKRERVPAYLTPALSRRLAAYARRTGVSRSNAIAILIDRGLQNTGQTALDFDPATGEPA